LSQKNEIRKIRNDFPGWFAYLSQMPVSIPFALKSIDQNSFAKLDFEVMRHAFECQNDLGQLCEEGIYQQDLRHRLTCSGIPAFTEVPITVTHRDFTKTYWLDLAIDNSAIYELKTASALIGDHEAQLLNYLFLCGSHHGKLINFRRSKVEARFVNAPASYADRSNLLINADRWSARDQTDEKFLNTIFELTKNWGWGLDLALYAEALIHFAGGELAVAQRLPLKRGGVALGNQLFHLLSDDTAFRLTALNDRFDAHEKQLVSLLKLSPLRRMHWINMARGRVSIVSLEN
jgi:GxxExxY protein